MPNPGHFNGAREAFLDSVKAEFAQAVKANAVKEKRADIIRCYYLRFPVAKGDSYEPTAEELAAVDDKATPQEETPQIKSPEDQAEYDKQVKAHGEFVRVKNGVSARASNLNLMALMLILTLSANWSSFEVHLRQGTQECDQQGPCFRQTCYSSHWYCWRQTFENPREKDLARRIRL